MLIRIFFRIEHHNFDSWITLPHRPAQFLGVKIGQAAIQKKHLPAATFQVEQRFRSSCCLLKAA